MGMIIPIGSDLRRSRFRDIAKSIEIHRNLIIEIRRKFDRKVSKLSIEYDQNEYSNQPRALVTALGPSDEATLEHEYGGRVLMTRLR